MGSIEQPGHALVFGASGINGWAFVNAILNDYPTSDSFDRVTAFTNRPLSAEASQWPQSNKLHLVSGLDLISNDQEALERELLQKVPHVDRVTALYFCAYVMDVDPEKEIALNIGMLKKTILAIEKLSPSLRVVALPTGVKAYGVHMLDKFPFKDNLPLKETHPPIPEPYRSQLFYTHQWELLKSLSQGKQWTYFDSRPDVIIGFVPNNSAHNLAQWVALYLSLCRKLYGEGAEVFFPGTKSWNILSNDSCQDTIARFTIYASLHPEISAAKSLNCSDNSQPTSWSVKWPIICEYFGLKGVAPTNGPGPDPAKFLHEHQAEWAAMENEYGLQTGHLIGDKTSLPHVSYFLMSQFDFDRQVDLTEMHRVWGEASEERDIKDAWYTAFDRFRKAKIIP
ncbi:hypothetical protein ATEIFO6365_0008004300 [Aspergillus terreus]|uniref:PRISE-like Rossmann-fold domain-containing protein n=1 Tax=Aspergillus terreus TaxID=33178 RepID=A0A5M3Z5I3_ASPTE|nr:hypothetical protein ATETN484_0010005200 [Aspergillus terreus]GFF18102.1 hypothetical protein ATEIFO6365_0008004300 [Aspergillus terreus]